MAYQSLKAKCLEKGTLYEDPEFPASAKSLYYSKVDPKILWRRPQEIHNDPSFIVGSASRFDLDQGAIGNCWYIAAAATLATRPELFKRVVPEDQGFGSDYAGIFHFYFWRYGQWEEVVIDDRLPVMFRFGRYNIHFCFNREEKNEFWSALLEKAYAKLHGSYEALEGGWTEDALVDFTGGVGQRINLKEPKEVPKDLYDVLLQYYNMSTLMGCSINATRDTMESELSNGLVIGHAYSVTNIMELVLDHTKHELIRLRNPWGKKEWKGAWSDKSKEWRSLDAMTRKKVGLITEEDGEFWMSFSDWFTLFEQLQLCHVPSENTIKDRNIWMANLHDGTWVKGVSAGGNKRSRSYWTNPQYCVSLKEQDDDDKEAGCSLIVSLMQKYTRELRTRTATDLTTNPVGYDIYKVKDRAQTPLEGDTYEKYDLRQVTPTKMYDWYRELSAHYLLPAGNYVIIPSTYDSGTQGAFLLRMLTKKSAESSEIDVTTGPIVKPEVSAKDRLKDIFQRHSGKDTEVDAVELQGFLNEAFAPDMTEGRQFEREECRTLLAMMDRDQTGVLEFDEVRQMMMELTTWKRSFYSFDKDKSGYIETKELKSIFKAIGFNLSKRVLKSIVRRYGGKHSRLDLQEFLMAVSKVVVMLDIFTKFSKKGLSGKAELSLEEWMEVTMYF